MADSFNIYETPLNNILIKLKNDEIARDISSLNGEDDLSQKMRQVIIDQYNIKENFCCFIVDDKAYSYFFGQLLDIEICNYRIKEAKEDWVKKLLEKICETISVSKVQFDRIKARNLYVNPDMTGIYLGNIFYTEESLDILYEVIKFSTLPYKEEELIYISTAIEQLKAMKKAYDVLPVKKKVDKLIKEHKEEKVKQTIKCPYCGDIIETDKYIPLISYPLEKSYKEFSCSCNCSGGIVLKFSVHIDMTREAKPVVNIREKDNEEK